MAVSQVETSFWLGALLTVLQGSVVLHYMPRILYDFGVDPTIAKAAPAFEPTFYAHAAVTVILLALPGLLSLLIDEIAVPLENALMRLRLTWGKQTFEAENKRRIVVETYESILLLDESLQDILNGTFVASSEDKTSGFIV